MTTSTDTAGEFTSARPLLFSIAYRITGSRADAEDVVQEAWLRWRDVDRTGVDSPKAFLTTVVSRLSLDSLKSARRRREVYVGQWLPEPLVGPVSEPAELAESLSMAFLHVMERLSPEERVAFLLREVFESPYREVAATLDTSEANARQLVSRARAHLRSDRVARAVDRDEHALVFRAFMDACAGSDTAQLTSLLHPDAVLYSDGGGKTTAALNPILGADRIIRFIVGLRTKFAGRYGGFAAEVNGQPGAILTLDDKPHTVLALDVEAGRVRGLYYSLNRDKWPRELAREAADSGNAGAV